MAYTAVKNSSGTYDVSLNGSKVATGTSAILGNYGLSEGSLSGSAPTNNAVDSTGASAYVGNTALNPQFSYTAPQQSTQPTVPQTQQVQPGSSIPTGGGNTTQPQQSVPTGQSGQQQQQAPITQQTPVFNGSIVDLLNSAGQDSSYQARAQLAKQFGVQGYTGSASQNTDLAKKFLDAYKAKLSSNPPATGADARSQLNEHFNQQGETTPPNEAQQTFFDQYLNMNPAMKSMYDSISQYFSNSNVKTSLSQEYQNLMAEQGLPAIQTDLMNMKRIMAGTEDDIRDEIGKVGGFATESQVAAMTGARNKVLLKQAQGLQDQISQKEDYIDHIMQFTQADRAQLDKDISTKLGIVEKMADMESKMQTAASDNLNNVVKNVGYKGLAESFGTNISGMRRAEKVLGLPSGSLQNPVFLSSMKDPNKKPLEYINANKYQRGGVFDPNSGTFTGMNTSGGSSSEVGGIPGGSKNQPYIDAFNAATAGTGSSTLGMEQSTFNHYLQNGDLSGARKYIAQLALKSAPSDEQKSIVGRTGAVNAIDEIQGLLAQLKEKGVNTNLMTGGILAFNEKLGQTNDPDLSYISGRITTALQAYRRSMTGVAFGPGEAAEYKKILPDISNVDSLNEAKINAFRDSLNNFNRSALALYMGGTENYDSLFGPPSTSHLPTYSQDKGILISRKGEKGYISSMMEFDPNTDMII